MTGVAHSSGADIGRSRVRTDEPGHAGTRFSVLGVEVDAIDPDRAVDRISSWVEDGAAHYVCVTGVHGIMESQRDPGLLRIHNASDMTTPDGMPLVWAAHRLGLGDVRRVYGPDLMEAVCRVASERGWRSFFYGGGPGVADALVAQLRARNPALQVAGVCCPPFRPLTPTEDEEVVRTIRAARPDLVWVGLSTPKQERWMADHIARLGPAVLLGVGAAFDINAGRHHRAPPWMQEHGLEWLYRLAHEPRRLWRRYLVNNPQFVWKVLRDRPTVVEGTEQPP